MIVSARDRIDSPNRCSLHFEMKTQRRGTLSRWRMIVVINTGPIPDQSFPLDECGRWIERPSRARRSFDRVVAPPPHRTPLEPTPAVRLQSPPAPPPVGASMIPPHIVERRTFPIPILDQPTIQVLAPATPSVVASDDE
jgi:hypothetical protein